MSDPIVMMGIGAAMVGAGLGFLMGYLRGRVPSIETSAVAFDDARGWQFCLPLICHECHQSHLAVIPGRAGGNVDTVRCLKCDTRFPLASNAILCQGVARYQDLDQGGAFGPNAAETRTKDYGSLANRTGLTDQDRGSQ